MTASLQDHMDALPRPQKDERCSLGILLAGLSVKDAKILRGWLLTPMKEMPSLRIADALHAAKHTIHRDTVTRHREMRCRCGTV